MAKDKKKKGKHGRKGSLSKEEKAKEKAEKKRQEAAEKDDTDYEKVVAEAYDAQDKILNLTSKQLPPHSAKPLTEFIGKQLDMEKLLISRNALEDTGIGLLCNKLQGLAADKKLVNLKTWQLSDNNITVEGAQHFGETLRLCESLTEVDASHNYLGPMPSNQMNVKGIKRIAQAIRHHPNLVSLDLTNTKVGDAGVELLCEHLKKNEKLEVINLARNQIGAAGMQALLGVYTEHKTLATIDLADNALEDDKDALEALKAIQEVCDVRTAEREARLAEEARLRAEAERLRLLAQKGAMLRCVAMCNQLIIRAARDANSCVMAMHKVVAPIFAAYYAARAAEAALPAAESAIQRAINSQRGLLAAVAPTQPLAKGHKKPTQLRTWFGVQVDVPPGAHVLGVRAPRPKSTSDALPDTAPAELGFEVSLKQGKWQAGSRQGQLQVAKPTFGKKTTADDGVSDGADSGLPPSAGIAIEGDASLTPLDRALLLPLPRFEGHSLTLVSTSVDVDLRWGTLDAASGNTPEQERQQQLELEGLNALRLVLSEPATITMSHSLFLDPELALAAKRAHLQSIGALGQHEPIRHANEGVHEEASVAPMDSPDGNEHGAFTVGMRAFPTLRQIAQGYSERTRVAASEGGFGVAEQQIRSLGVVDPLKTLAVQSGIEVLVLRHVGCAEMGWQFRAEVDQRHVDLLDGPWRQHRPACNGTVKVGSFQQHSAQEQQEQPLASVMTETAREMDDFGRLWVRVRAVGALPAGAKSRSINKGGSLSRSTEKGGSLSQALKGRGLYSSAPGSERFDAERKERALNAARPLKEWAGDTKSGLFQTLQRSRRVKELDRTFSSMMTKSSGTSAGNAALMALGDSSIGGGVVTDAGAVQAVDLEGWVCASSMLVQASVGNNGRVRGGRRRGESEVDQVRRQWDGWAWTVLPAEQWSIDECHFRIKVCSFEPVAVVQLHTSTHHKHSGLMAPTSNQLASAAPPLPRSLSHQDMQSFNANVHLPHEQHHPPPREGGHAILPHVRGSSPAAAPSSFPFRERLYVMPLVPPPVRGSIRIKVLIPNGSSSAGAARGGLMESGRRRARGAVDDATDPLADSIAHNKPDWATKQLEHEGGGGGHKAESEEKGEEGDAAATIMTGGRLSGDTLVELRLSEPIVVWVCPAKVDSALLVRQWGARQHPQPLMPSSNAYGKRRPKPGHEALHVGHGETVKVCVCGVSARRKWSRGGYKRYEYDRLVVSLQLLREMLDRNDPLVIPGCVAAVTHDGFGPGHEDVVEALQVCLPLPDDVEDQLRAM
jgi:hypothetical protein